MIYTELTKKAMQIAYDAHKGQVDKSGLPYIYHPIHLAEQMNDEVSVCVALLHDVVEDTGMTFEDLSAQGISVMVIDALKLLTHDEAVPYSDYVQKIKDSGNQAAIAVKLVDMRHNSDVSRLGFVDGKAVKRLAKYRKAIEVLEQCKTSNVYIEREVGTGWNVYRLRVGDRLFCTSENQASMPRPYSAPIQTYHVEEEKTFSTIKNPAYEHITIVPGLKLEYPVYEDGNPNPIAKMERAYGDYTNHTLFSSSGVFDRYAIINGNDEQPLGIHFVAKEAAGYMNKLTDIAVSVYPDDSFQYNSNSLVEERYIVNIDEKHFQWLHHIFHAFILRRSI